MFDNAVIFAAGMCSRMNYSSKAMKIVAGKPLITYALDALIENGIKKIFIIYRSDDNEILQLPSIWVHSDIQLVFIEDSLKQGSVKAHRLFADVVSYPLLTLDCDIIIHSLSLTKAIQDCTVLFSNPEVKASVAVVDNPIFKGSKTLRLLGNRVIAHSNLGFSDGKEGGYIFAWRNSLVSVIDEYYLKDQEYRTKTSFFSYYLSKNKVCAMHIDYLWDVDDMDVLLKTEIILKNHILW